MRWNGDRAAAGANAKNLTCSNAKKLFPAEVNREDAGVSRRRNLSDREMDSGDR